MADWKLLARLVFSHHRYSLFVLWLVGTTSMSRVVGRSDQA